MCGTIFGVKGQTCLIGDTREHEALELQFPKTVNIFRNGRTFSRNRDPSMTNHEHVYAICCRSEVAGYVISGENVKTVEGYAVLYFEVASLSSFGDV